MQRELSQNFSGNAVCYTACSLLLKSRNSCSKLYCHESFDSILFSCERLLVSSRCAPQQHSFMVLDLGLTIQGLELRVWGSVPK